MDIYENLEQLNVSEECFEDIMSIVEKLLNEESLSSYKKRVKDSGNIFHNEIPSSKRDAKKYIDTALQSLKKRKEEADAAWAHPSNLYALSDPDHQTDGYFGGDKKAENDYTKKAGKYRHALAVTSASRLQGLNPSEAFENLITKILNIIEGEDSKEDWYFARQDSIKRNIERYGNPWGPKLIKRVDKSLITPKPTKLEKLDLSKSKLNKKKEK